MMGFGMRTGWKGDDGHEVPRGVPQGSPRYVRAKLERPTAERIEGTFETPYGRLTVSVYVHGEYHVYLGGRGEEAVLEDAVVMGQMFEDGSLSAVPRGLAAEKLPEQTGSPDQDRACDDERR